MKQKETNKKRFNLKQKPWAFLLFFIIIELVFNLNIYTANAQQAGANQSGDTNVGKWYTNQSIVLRTETDIAGSDGVWKENANFIRIGNESSSGYKVRLKIFLESPSQLTFAPNQWVGNPQRDSIRGRDRNLGFTDNFYGLVGYGGFVLGEGNSYCHEINIAKFVWNEGSLINICEQKKGSNPWQGYSRADFPQLKDPVTGQTRTVVKSGELLGKIEFSFKNSELKSTGMDKPGIYKIESWPHLIINTGDSGIIEKLVVGFVETQSMIQGAKVVQGAGSLSLSLVEKVKKGVLSLPDAIAQVKAKLLANGATATEAEHVAEGMVKGSQVLYDAYGTKLTQETVAKSTNIIIESAIGKGSRAIDLMSAAAQETVGSAVANGGSQAVGALEPALQTTAQVVESKLAASGVEKVAAKTAAQGAFKTVLKNGLKFVSLAGWIYTFTEVGLYFTSFTNEQVTWYTTNKHLLGVQVYDTEKEAQDHKDDPQPNDVPPPETKTGAGQAIGGTGSPLLGFLNQLINFLVGLLQELVYLVFYYFIAPIIQAMLNIRTYTDVFAAVIYPGWEVVRNVCNILFIVALIAIGLGTLFRVESYQYKHLLVDLIIAALLVNFSLVIAQAVLGVADTVQSQFLPNNVEVIRSLARDLMAGWKNMTWDFKGTGYFSNTIQPLFALALSIGSFVVFSALAGFLVVRIVMLWVLLMLSPLAYAMRVLPTTKSYAAKWWGEFLKYAFFTPIIAFFLNMAAVINNQYNAAFNGNGSVLQKLIDDPSLVGNSSLAQFVFRVGSNVIILVFLVIAIKAAEQAGVFGADVVAKAAKGGMMAPLKALGTDGLIGGYAARKWNEYTANKIRGHERAVGWKSAVLFAAANPMALAKGLKKRREELDHAAQAKAEAAGLEVAEQRFSTPKAFFQGGKKIFPRVLAHEKHEEDEWAKQYMNMSRENVARTAHEVFQMADNDEGLAAKRGIIKVAMAKGYIDDIIMEAGNNEEGKKMIAAMKAKGLINEKEDIDKDGVLQYNSRTRRALYKLMFGVDSHGNLKDHAGARLITEEGEKEGMDTGHLEYMSDMYFDVKSGHYKFYKMGEDSKRAAIDADYREKEYLISAGFEKMAGAEIAKRNSRTQAGIAWHSLMSSDGEQLYAGVYNKVAKAFSENPTFMQERTANMLMAHTTDDEKLKEILENYKNTGELVVDEVTAKRIKKMQDQNEQGLMGIFSRFTNDAGAGFQQRRLKEGGFKMSIVDKDGKVVKNDSVKWSAKSAEAISDQTFSAITDDNSTFKVSKVNAGMATAALKVFDTSVTLPQFEDLVTTVEAAGISDMSRNDAVKISGQYMQNLIKKRLKKVDIANKTDYLTASTNIAAVETALSPQEIGRFNDVLNEAVQKGLSKASTFAASDAVNRTAAIRDAVEKALANKDLHKEMGGIDLSTTFNADEFANNVYAKVK